MIITINISFYIVSTCITDIKKGAVMIVIVW